jgi:hypothetical protein
MRSTASMWASSAAGRPEAVADHTVFLGTDAESIPEAAWHDLHHRPPGRIGLPMSGTPSL